MILKSAIDIAIIKACPASRPFIPANILIALVQKTI